MIAAQPVFRRLLRAHRYDVLHYFFGLPTGALALYPLLLLDRTRLTPAQATASCGPAA